MKKIFAKGKKFLSAFFFLKEPLTSLQEPPVLYYKFYSNYATNFPANDNIVPVKSGPSDANADTMRLSILKENRGKPGIHPPKGDG
jgi:hypothetical protein